MIKVALAMCAKTAVLLLGLSGTQRQIRLASVMLILDIALSVPDSAGTALDFKPEFSCEERCKTCPDAGEGHRGTYGENTK